MQKEYIYLCLKKWSAYSSKEELIPAISPEFYVSESFKVTPAGAKNSCILYVVLDSSVLSQISIDIYLERLHAYIKDIFPSTKRIKTDI